MKNVEQLIEDGKKQNERFFIDAENRHCDVTANEAFALGVRHALAAMVPDRYTPREEVTEGWWSAKHRREKGRHIVYVCSTPHSTDLTLRAWGPGCMIGSLLDEYADFLPVPAWLVEGVGKQPK